MKKRSLIIFGSLIGVVLAIGSSSISYALFTSSVRINQGVGSIGLLKKSIYLCPQIWEVDSPLYELHVFNSSSGSYEDLRSSKTVSIEVSNIEMNCRVYLLDTVAYDKFVFYRKNPSTGDIWNQTDDIVWDGSKNVYRIIEWDNNMGHHHSGYNSYTF